MNGRLFKERFIEALFNRDVFTKQVNDQWYKTRCPYCGDTQKTLTDGHFYICVNMETNSPIGYNCFRCPEHGIIRHEQLEMLGITDMDLLGSVSKVNSKFEKIAQYGGVGDKFKVFPYKLPDRQKGAHKIQYIEDRMGIKVDSDFVNRCKLVTSLKSFLKYNEVDRITCQPFVADIFEKYCIGFMSYNNSHLIFRDITDTQEISWQKYSISPSSIDNYVCYALSAEIDRFTEEAITINLAEGVFDIIGVAYHLGYNRPNCINMAVCGKRYYTIIDHLIGKGLVGDNVVLNIFSDNDEKFNKGKKNNYDTSLPYFKSVLTKYTYMFKEVNVWYNQTYKDCGTIKENIHVKRFRI